MNSFGSKSPVFILDVDGVITDGRFAYSIHGKETKTFGADDWDMLLEFSQHVPIHFITADVKGFEISQKRIEDDCGFALDLVSGDPYLRWAWIWKTYPQHEHFIIFIGDGCKDFVCLSRADYSITTSEALEHTKSRAMHVTTRAGGNRAVAEAVLHLMETFGIRWAYDEFRQEDKEVLFHRIKTR